MARVHVQTDRLTPGEHLVRERLERDLPDEGWDVFVGRLLPTPDGGSREFDFIVIGPHAVFVLEDKHWHGRVFGTDRYWMVASGESRPSPINQVDRCAKHLAGVLRREIVRLSQHFVFPYVVLSAEDVQLSVHDPRVKTMVCRLSELVATLKARDRELDPGIATVRHRIVDYLLARPQRPKVPAKVNAYEVRYKLGAIGPILLLDAVHGQDRYILKLVPAAQREDMLREYEVLHLLQERCGEYVPRVAPYIEWSDGEYLVIPIRYPEGRTIRTLRGEQEPTLGEFVRFVANAFRGLALIHGQDVVHRAINPDHVWVDARYNVQFTDFMVARYISERTVAHLVDELNPEDPYRAPECAAAPQMATPKSDVYSLALTALYLATGAEPEHVLEREPEILKRLPAKLGNLLRRALNKSPADRPAAREIAEAATAILEPDTHITTGDVLEDRYLIERRLGSGGTGETFLAYDSTAERLVVLKRIRTKSLYDKVTLTELTFAQKPHKHIRLVYDIYPWEHPFHLKMQYLDGRPLSELRQQFLGNLDRCLRFAVELLDTLAYMEHEGILHRDIKPANIIADVDRPEEQFWLIDFGIASLAKESKTVIGTPAYQPIEVDRGEPFPPSGDRYAAAVLLFQLFTGQLPFRTFQDGRYDKQRFAVLPDEYTDPAARNFLRALLWAMDPDPQKRPASAEELKRELLGIAIGPPSQGELLVNPTVNWIRAAYRNSALGNAENRGWSSEFARKTYVPTGLDLQLLPALLEGKYRCVLLSGNPGDGKTAFLQRLLAELKSRGATVASEDRYGWEASWQGRRYRAVYDASESQRGRSPDDVLKEVLAPCLNRSDDANYTALIAINDGRMFDFFERHTEFLPIWRSMSDEVPGEYLLVDLKRRSVVLAADGRPPFVRRLLAHWTDQQLWQVCERCKARTACPIKYNVEHLRVADEQTEPPAPVAALERLLAAVHLRREFRPTIRDIRSALAYTLTADLGCEQVHRFTERTPPEWLDFVYVNTVFGAPGDVDPMVEQLRAVDPATVPHPRLDRFIMSRATVNLDDVRRMLAADGHGGLGETGAFWQIMEQLSRSAGEQDQLEQLHRTWIRYLYFVGNDERLMDLGIDRLRDLLPYRYLDLYRDLLRHEVASAETLLRLAKGIAHMDGLPAEALFDQGTAVEGFAFTLSRAEHGGFAVVKLFPLSEFELVAGGVADEVTDSVVDALLLRHTSGATLKVSLDLLELALRAAEGYVMSFEEAQPFLQELSEFKSRLLLQRAREVLLVEGSSVHKAVFEDDKLKLLA